MAKCGGQSYRGERSILLHRSKCVIYVDQRLYSPVLVVSAQTSWVKGCRLSVYVGGETGGTRLLPEPGADPEMQELGHPCEAPRHEAEQLKVDDGLAVLQKTLVNTGYSGHTLTLTLPASMNELNELLRVLSCSMTALLQPLSRTILWISVFNKSMDWRKPHYSQQTSAWTQPLST